MNTFTNGLLAEVYCNRIMQLGQQDPSSLAGGNDKQASFHRFLSRLERSCKQSNFINYNLGCHIQSFICLNSIS
jgi:hypothetical protein